jgi:peptidoglycan/LPS O-acetylase OafA/YrhL
MIKQISRSFGLDLARATAICLVIAAHFGHKNYDALGFWGVELFFALSGFLIGQILWRSFSEPNSWNAKQLFNFWSRRWWRTLPNYYLFFAIMLVFHHLHGDGLPGLARLSSFLWFGQNLWHTHFSFYPVAWSLCIEEWFYLLFPLLLLIVFELGANCGQAFVITLCIFFIFSVTVRIIMRFNGVDGMSLRAITFTRLDSIACGVTIAYLLMVFKPSNLLKKYAFLIGVVLITVPAVIMYYNNKSVEVIQQNPFILLIMPLGFAFTLPLLSLLQAPTGFFKFIGSPVNKLSLWSYSIYLSHVPLMWVSYYLMAGVRNSMYGNLLSKVLALALTIAVSGFIFNYFEAPLTRKRPAELRAGNTELKLIPSN